jgi:hypothetical protein
LTRLVVQTVLTGQSASYNELEIQLRDFNVAGAPFDSANPNSELIHQFAETKFGIANRDLMIFFSPGVRVFILSLESERPDKFIRRTFETIRDASDRQLTGAKAGIVCVKFEAIPSDELAEIGQETGAPSHLRREASRFLDGRRKSHLTCVGFFADDQALGRKQSDVSRGGSSYFFENPESPYYSRSTLAAFGGVDVC